MADERPDAGGDDGDAQLRRYIRAGSALVLGAILLAWGLVPSLRGTELSLGLFVGGLLMLGGFSIDDIPWLPRIGRGGKG